MIDLVLDASVVLKWLAPEPENLAGEAGALRGRYAAGEVIVHTPRLIFQEVLNVAARRWRFDEASLVELAETLEGFGFNVQEPDLTWIAKWAACGISAYDATYVALADQMEIPLVTADDEVIATAAEIAHPLAAVAALFAQ